MKRTFLCLLAALVLAATTNVAAAPPATTEITVSGQGTVLAAPDQAIVAAGVETNAASAEDAVSQNNVTYDRIVGVLQKLGIDRNAINLTSYGVSYNPRPQVATPDSGSNRYGYTVSRAFSVRVRQIGKAGTVTDACIGAGATAIYAVLFDLSDSKAMQAQALRMAVADARSHAEALARDSGLHVVRIKSMALENASYPGTGLRAIAHVTAKNTAFDTSNVDVAVMVTVVFLAEP